MNRLLCVSAFLAALTLGATPPATCYKTTTMLNDLGKNFATVKDESKVKTITSKHVLVKVKACFDKTRILGVRTTFGVWSGGKITKEVKMIDHGNMTEDKKKDIDCSSADIKEGDAVAEMVIYSTTTAITRIKTTTAKGSIKEMGPSKGTKNSGTIPFARKKNVVDALWGFAAKKDKAGTLGSLAVTLYDADCVTKYLNTKPTTTIKKTTTTSTRKSTGSGGGGGLIAGIVIGCIFVLVIICVCVCIC